MSNASNQLRFKVGDRVTILSFSIWGWQNVYKEGQTVKVVTVDDDESVEVEGGGWFKFENITHGFSHYYEQIKNEA
jgi:hypothetical protein